MMAMNIAGLGGYSRRARSADGPFVLREPIDGARQTVAVAAVLRTLRQICGTSTMSAGRGRSPAVGCCRVESFVPIDVFQSGGRSSFGGLVQ